MAPFYYVLQIHEPLGVRELVPATMKVGLLLRLAFSSASGPHGYQSTVIVGVLQEIRADFAARDIPFVFDPGQGLPMFNGQELTAFLKQANYLAFNDYESRLFQERTNLTLAQISERVKAVIVTKGGEGSEIHSSGAVYNIPTAKTEQVSDPTGCGDAYRAGLLYGIVRGMDWETTGRLAEPMATEARSTNGSLSCEVSSTRIPTYK